jgi:anti-sigma B factor antagonist
VSSAKPPVEFQIDEHALGGHAYALDVHGELDLHTAPVLRERVGSLLDQGATGLLLDLSEVTFIDSIAVAVIVGAQRRLEGTGRVAIIGTGEYVELIFEAGGLDGVLARFDERSEAEGYVGASNN